MASKPALRARLRAARDVQAAHPVPGPPPQLTERFTAGLVIASYIPMAGEFDPQSIVTAALAAGCRLALPHVTMRAHPMRFLAWPGDAALVPGPMGLRQPAADLPALTPDIVLTPLLGFDRHGNRLGQGAGYYDRAFAALPNAWRVGLAWSVQEVEALAPDPWDVPLHAVMTEKEWIVP